MTKTVLIEDLKRFLEDTLKDFVLPVNPSKENPEPEPRAFTIFKQKAPDEKSVRDKAPCILVQMVGSVDQQESGSQLQSDATVRLVFMTYCKDKEEGAMALIEAMERVRIRLLKMIFLNNQFELQLSAGIDTTIYNDDTGLFSLGEMVTTWRMPPVKREVRFF